LVSSIFLAETKEEKMMMKQPVRWIPLACTAFVLAGILPGRAADQAQKTTKDLDPKMQAQIAADLAKNTGTVGHGGKVVKPYITEDDCHKIGGDVYDAGNGQCSGTHLCCLNIHGGVYYGGMCITKQ
jgi:hypothetical protein